MKKIKELFMNIFFYALVIEFIEEILEDIIAYTISTVILKGVSTMIAVTVSYSLKIAFKRIIKSITYKEGNDKVNKIKEFFKLIFSNKKSIAGTIGIAFSTLTGTGIVDIEVLPTIMVGSCDIAPFLYYGVLAILVIIGITGKGWETTKAYDTRKAAEKVEKEAKAIVKEAKKEIKQAKKKAAQSQTQKEKADAKEAAKKLAEEEKKKADDEHKAKVEAAKAKILEEEKKLAENKNNA